MGHKILSVASEWFSYHGGLSTFNRSFCAALAAAGHQTVCLVPRGSIDEINDAFSVGVSLVFPSDVPGLSDEAMLCLNVDLDFEPDVIVGHGHITGPAAAARVRQFHPTARRIHVLHTLPDEIEPFKDRIDEDPARRAHRKQALEIELSVSADLAVAVGPRLHRQWSTLIGGAQNGVGVHRLTPGLPALRPIESVPQSYWCLLMGRLEDAELKGVDLAATALGIINQDNHFSGAREVTLVLRGAEPGKSREIREYVHKHAGAEVPLTIREYTHREDDVRKDIACASVVLMPSRMEGFGLVGVEALAMGVPILVSQRSGFGELLMELIDANPSLAFAKRFIVKVGDGTETDSVRWADAIREVLVDREKAVEETAVLRNAILKADYWPRAVADLFGVLNIPPRDPSATTNSLPDLAQRAHRILDIDPANAIVFSSSLLEREMQRVIVSEGIADSWVPARKQVLLLRDKGVFDQREVNGADHILHLRNKAAHDFDATFSVEQAKEHLRAVEVLVAKLKQQFPIESSTEATVSDVSQRASAAYKKGGVAEALARQSPDHVEKAMEAAELFAEAACLTEEQQNDDYYTEEVRKVAVPLAHYYWAMSHKSRGWYRYEKRDCEAALDSLAEERSSYRNAIDEAERLMPELSKSGQAFLQPQLESWRVYLEMIPSVEYAYRGRNAWEKGLDVEALDWYRHSIEESDRVLKLADNISPTSNPAAVRIMRANAHSTKANAFKVLARHSHQRASEKQIDLFDFSRDEGLQFFGYLLQAYESGMAAGAENPEAEHGTVPRQADRKNLEEFLRKCIPQWGAILAKFSGNNTVCMLMEHIDRDIYAAIKN